MSEPTPDPRLLAARFPARMRWSAATSSFQIEGARTGDGRGRSIWDTQVDVPGWVKDGSTAEPGPDSYHRFGDDIALLRELGVDRYRFSLSWVRIQPDGTGPAETRGLDYYDRLVDGLLDAGITPFPTLYHWDHPQWLEDAGGWLTRDMADRFADYTGIVAGRLGDRVQHWYTINEPVSMSLQGYGLGTLAPARQLLFGALATVHHQLLAHGRAVQALRAAGGAEIGIPNNHTLVRPLHPDDGAAVATYDLLHNRIFADPLLSGAYPDLEAFGLPPMPVRGDDMAVISEPLDFYGVNFYNPTTVTRATEPGPLPFEIVPTPGAPVTGFGPEWPIEPPALRELLIDFRERYGDGLPPSSSARTAPRSPSPTSRPECRTTTASPTSPVTSPPSPTPWTRASTSANTRCGRCWTTSSGPTASRSASGSSTSTSARPSAHPRHPSTGTARSSERHTHDVSPHDQGRSALVPAVHARVAGDLDGPAHAGATAAA